MDCIVPGFPVLHYLLEFAQTRVHWVSDAIQPSHLLSSPSPPAFNLSQHQGLFQWVSSLHQVTKVLELTHWKRPWFWERVKEGGEGNGRGWDGWMASPTRWTWVWVNSNMSLSWWSTGRPGVLQFMGSQRIGHDLATKLNWTEQHRAFLSWKLPCVFLSTFYITV